MEYLLFIAIVLALIEWRDVKQNNRYHEIEKLLVDSFKRLESDASAGIENCNRQIADLKEEIAPLAEFLMKAHTDLATIVQEYELNGIPLHLRRGIPEQPFDAVEGL